LSWAKKKWGKEALKRVLGVEKKNPAASPNPKDRKSLLLQRLKDDAVILSKNFIAQTKPAVAIEDEREIKPHRYPYDGEKNTKQRPGQKYRNAIGTVWFQF
jgi:hypothetical protein